MRKQNTRGLLTAWKVSTKRAVPSAPATRNGHHHAASGLAPATTHKPSQPQPDSQPPGQQAVAEFQSPTAPAETVVTSVVGPCGRFILPLEPWLTKAFHQACQRAGKNPSEVLAEVCHAEILAVVKKGGH